MSISPSEPGTSSTSSTNGTINAVYFNGRSAAAHPVTLTLDGDILRMRGTDIALDNPVAALRVSEAMGAAPRLISFPDGTHCEVRDHTGLAHMLTATGFKDSWVVRIQQRWRWALASIAVTLAAVFAGYHWGLPAASEWLAFQTPDAVLARMGGSTLTILDRTAFAPSKLPEARQLALRTAFEQMAVPGGVKPRYALHFRHGGLVGANALALPDGTIVVTDQLVSLAKHDEEILAVLAHELGHIQRRHGLRMLIQGSIVAFVVSFYIGDVSSVAAGLPTLLLQARYSREHEREADRFGAAMLKVNGVSPLRLAEMLNKLEASHRTKSAKAESAEENASTADRRKSGIGDYLASHPATKERMDALMNSK